MNLLKRLFKRNKKEQTVVTTRNLAEHMQKTRTIKVPNYKEKKAKEIKISMFH